MLNVAAKEGGFGEVKPIKGSPIAEDQVLQNIRDSAGFVLPMVKKRPARQDTMVFVAGGPTLNEKLEEIRQRSRDGAFIATSNNTHDFLVGHGIVPDACFIFDPKEKVKDYVKLHQWKTTYYLATVCNKAVFESFLSQNARVEKVVLAYGLDGQTDINLQRELYPDVQGSSYLVGGTMTPLRAIPFAYILGFRSVEFYGFDSCFGSSPNIIEEGEPGYTEALMAKGIGYDDRDTGRKYVVMESEEGGFFYAYKKARIEDIMVAEVGSRRFLTSPGFAYQAKQLVDWVDRMEDKMSVTVHGDSLSSYLLERHRAKKEQERAAIGDRRWTDEYAAMQRTLHETTQYGTRAAQNRGGQGFGLVTKMVLDMRNRLQRDVTVLDYGCGNCDLGNALEASLKGVHVTNYDPFQDDKSAEPDIHDMVVCLDVMEHVEEQCVENTLRYMAKRSRYGGLFIISLQDAVKTLPDGRNAHVTVKNARWWKNRLANHFTVCQEADYGHTGVFIVESQKAEEMLQQEAA